MRSPGAARKPRPTARHLTASMRVSGAHLHMRHVSIAVARDEVMEAARRVEAGTAGEQTEGLRAKLDRDTGCEIAELAKCAEQWRD
jgi:hypothetical protein